MTIYDELVARGLVAQVTDEEEIKDLINNGKATFYIGFDPTADSLHVGHFMALVMRTLPQVTAGKAGPAPLISGGYTKLTLFGQEMVGMCGVASRVMEVLAKAGVAIYLVTTSSVDISLLVAAEDEDTAIDTLRQAFSL